MEDNNY
jgi:hypothetical protein